MIHIPSDVDDVFVVNNNIVGSSKGYGIYLDGSSGTVIKNNTIDLTLGIYIKSANGNSIHGNTIGNCSSIYGVRLSSSNFNNIENNRIAFNNNGIYAADSSENYIQGNVICDNSLNGLHIENGDGNIIKNNTINDNGNSGIDITSSDSQILENWIHTKIGRASCRERV